MVFAECIVKFSANVNQSTDYCDCSGNGLQYTCTYLIDF